MIWYNEYSIHERWWQVMMKGNRIREVLTDENPDAIIYDGMDDALIGVYRGTRRGQAGIYEVDTIAVYSYLKYIDILMEDMSEEEAVEYFDFNVDGLILGINQPVIIDDTGV